MDDSQGDDICNRHKARSQETGQMWDIEGVDEATTDIQDEGIGNRRLSQITDESEDISEMLNQEGENAVGFRQSPNDVALGSRIVTVIGSHDCSIGDQFTIFYTSCQSERNTRTVGTLDAGNTRRVIDESDQYKAHCQRQTQGTFVETTPYKEARQIIEETNSLLLTGGLGEGKSHILRYLSAHPVPGYLPITCKTPRQVSMYLNLILGTVTKLLFLIDETFGAEYTKKDLLAGWKDVGGDIEMHLIHHKFVFVARTSVWAECKVHLERSPFFCNVVEVTSANLTTEDKFRLLAKYMVCELKPTNKEIEEIVSNPNCIAYCQCCKLMADAMQAGHSGAELLEIFQRPFPLLYSELGRMETVAYATLSLIMLCGGQLKCVELTGTMSDVSSSVRERIDAVLDVLGCKELTCGILQRCAEFLCGTYLQKVRKTGTGSGTWEEYKFSHDCVQEAVIMHYGKCHFGHCLQFLNCDFLVATVRPHHYDKREYEFVLRIPSEYYARVAAKFTTMIFKGNEPLRHVFKNLCVKDELFQAAWIESLLDSTENLKGKAFTALFSRHITRCKSWDGRCVLYYAAEAGAEKLLRFLMDDKKMICQCGGEYSPICGAAVGDQADICRYLITAHHSHGDQFVQAVISACSAGSVNALRILLTQPDCQRQKTVESGLKSACELGHRGIMEILLPELKLEHRDSVFQKCLLSGIIWHHREAVECLLDSCYNPCLGDACVCGRGLKIASQVGQTDVALVLLSHGAKVNAVDSNDETCLQWATSRGHIDTATCLIQCGANVNARNTYRVSPLHRSAYQLNLDTMSLLLAHGANVNVRDNFLQTPLHVTLAEVPDHEDRLKCEKREDIVSNLLKLGTDVTIKDKWNRTVLDLATLECDQRISDKFAKYGHILMQETVEELSHPSSSDGKEISRAYRC